MYFLPRCSLQQYFKVIVHPKMLFQTFHEFLLKEDILNNVCNQTVEEKYTMEVIFSFEINSYRFGRTFLDELSL